MNNQMLEKYAELIVKIGINLQTGQNLIIKGDSCHWPFVDILQKVAYQNGAAYIKCDLTPPCSLLNRVKYQNEQYLSNTPSYMEDITNTQINEKWAYIRLDGSSDPDAYDKLNQGKIATIEKSIREKSMPFLSACMSGTCHWCIAPVPTKKWAAKVFNINNDEDYTEKLWETLIPILRLDKEDSIQAWEEHNQNLSGRIYILDNYNLEFLHFKTSESDLKIYLSPLSKWAGGNFADEKGVNFNPNIPTEEIFSSPDYRKTEGYVKVTKPVMVLGKYVENAWFEFKEGKVINYKASKNQESLDKFFEMDKMSRYLGEVALVDMSSPITKTDRLFSSILLDENASCHIALGRAIPIAIEGGSTMTQDELLKNGFNMSMLHTDFMIGSKELDVTGHKNDGSTISIIKQGYFSI